MSKLKPLLLLLRAVHSMLLLRAEQSILDGTVDGCEVQPNPSVRRTKSVESELKEVTDEAALERGDKRRRNLGRMWQEQENVSWNVAAIKSCREWRQNDSW